MHRRQYLATIAGGALGGVAGCAETVVPGSRQPATDEDPQDDGPVTGSDGVPGDICQRDPRPSHIPAIVEPAFAPDWSDLDQIRGLDPDEPVIGIERAGTARAYPISVLRLEIVNDTFDIPVIVTYCPLCSSGMVADRRIDGSATIFSNTSYTWRPPGAAGQQALDEGRVFGFGRALFGAARAHNDPNLVMFDRATGSYWSQLLAQAICGPLTGDRLTVLPSTVTDWQRWRERHPDTTVLLPTPHSRTVRG